MTAEVTQCWEYGTDKACEIGRLVYTVGARRYVALAFRYTAGTTPTPWRLTWLGPEGGDSSQLPKGLAPSEEMLAALEAAA